MKKLGLLWLVIFALGICSCQTAPEAPQIAEIQETIVFMEQEPKLYQQEPVQGSGIWVNEIGYDARDEKYAYIHKKSTEAEAFCVYQGDSLVLEKEIQWQKQAHGQSIEKVGILDFSEVSEPGQYYIYCKGYGQSYSFLIEEGLYGKLLEKGLEEYEIKLQENTALEKQEVLLLLTIMEWFPERLPETLKLELFSWLIKQQDSSAYMAGLLAKWGYLQRTQNKELSEQAIQRANEIMEESLRQEQIKQDAVTFFAAAELFRATRSWEYRVLADGHKETILKDAAAFPMLEYLNAAYTYMDTERVVYMSFCDALMQQIRIQGESFYDSFYQELEENQKGILALLWTNHMMESNVYNQLIEDYLACLEYRQPQALSMEILLLYACKDAILNGEE